MAVPVFVQDALGRPLMPAAPAHARKLLRQAKAQHIPHPAFTLIRLAQPVTAPMHHALRLDIDFRGSFAALTLILDRSQASQSLLTLLAFPPPRLQDTPTVSPRPKQVRSSRPGQQRMGRPGGRISQFSLTTTTSELSVDHFATIIGALRTFAPLNKLAVQRVSATASVDMFQSQLRDHPACVGLSVDTATSLSFPEHNAGQARKTPTVVAWCQRTDAELLQRQLLSSHLSIGMPVTGPLGNDMVSGIVAQRRPPRRLVLAIPAAVDGAAILWQYRIVRDAQHFRPRTEPVLFFPVTHPEGRTSVSDTP